jgi:transposase InsO family protein
VAGRVPSCIIPTKAQYTSEDSQRLLDSHGIVCSMSRRGNCWDNAAMESCFSILKTKRLSRKHSPIRDELRVDVSNYIEGSTLRSKSLSGTTPGADIPPSAISVQYNLKIHNVFNERVRSNGKAHSAFGMATKRGKS